MHDYGMILKNKILPATLNSYSVVFFFNDRLFGIVLLVVSFFNFFAGLSGLFAVILTVTMAGLLGFDELRIRQGIYSFNALLTGIGLGTFFEPGMVFFILLILATIFSLMISVILSGWLSKYGLPFLSIPFVLSFWLILLPSGQLTNLGLTQRNIFWMNEMYSIGGKPLLDFFQTIENLPVNRMVGIYFRSLSSIIFQDNMLAGILIAAALLFTSRISFMLSVAGFMVAYLFAGIAGTDNAGMSFYNIGANYILVAIAAGGFFVIPSRYSFLWLFLLVPLTSLLILFMTQLVPVFKVPFLSLPFSLIVIMFLYFLLLRVSPKKLALTPYQYYSPEINLYTYRSIVSRSSGVAYPLHLPFWGEWTVSQGYDGKFTHKGDWGKALDFVLTDDQGRTFEDPSGSCGSYYCYNKPVLAPADGIVAEISDNIDDNEPGKVNTGQNWGNTIIIKHLNYLYTQLSHLQPGTFRVKKGDFVRKGDILALCGNSGRSPEPHLHFQVQASPLTGAKTITYPLSYYLQRTGDGLQLRSFSMPSEGDRISNVVTGILFREAFNLQPGAILRFRYTIGSEPEKEVSWEVFTDAFNNSYLFCNNSSSVAYFVNDGTMFYFTSFSGDRNSLLYYFYLASYRVLLASYENIVISDVFPLHMISGNRLSRWLHDFIAPFYQYMSAVYTISTRWTDSQVNPSEVKLGSEIQLKRHKNSSGAGFSELFLSGNRIKEFSYTSAARKVWAQNISI